MKNQSPAFEKIQSLIVAHAQAVREVAELANQQQSTIAHLQHLELTVGLSDDAGLAEIGKVQILASLLPRRLEGKQAVIPQLEADLLTAIHEFIGSELGPKLRKIKEAVEAKVRTELKPIFPPAHLEQAILQSTALAEINRLQYRAAISSPAPDQLDAYVNGILQTWEAAQAYKI